MTQPDMHEAARRLAAFGLAVLPLHTVEDGKCTCGNSCSSPGKHPVATLAPHGSHDATHDAQTIDQWWALWPDANVGIATGSISGVTVVDVDYDAGGSNSIHHVQKNYYEIHAGWSAATGSGEHLYFEYVDGMKNRVGALPGIDIRNDNAYVVAPPSLHSSGKRYEWQERPRKSSLMPMENWFADILGHKNEQQQAAAPIPESISDGQRNNWLASAGGTMRRRGFSPEAIKSALHIENELKCKPPLESEEVDRIAWSISRYPAAVGIMGGGKHI